VFHLQPVALARATKFEVDNQKQFLCAALNISESVLRHFAFFLALANATGYKKRFLRHREIVADALIIENHWRQ